MKKMNKMKKHNACIATHLGWVEMNGEEAYRFVFDKSVDDILSSDFYKSKENEYWIKINKSDKTTTTPHKEKLVSAYKLDYITHVVRYPEFTPKQFIDSLKLICDISIYCLKNNIWCQTHIWNIIFKNGKPLLIDIGDFKKKTPTENDALSVIYSSFRKEVDEHCVVSPSKWIKNLDLILNNFNDIKNQQLNLIQKFESIKVVLDSAVLDNKDYTNSIDWNTYIKGFIYSKKDLSHIRLKFGEKSKTIYDKIIEIKPKTMIDIGCNLGLYSFVAENIGTKTVGVDVCPLIIDRANEIVKNNNLNCLFVSYDIMMYNESYGKNGSYDSPENRYRSDMLIAPAVIHHLFNQGYKIDEIINKFSNYAEKYMLIEWIPGYRTTLDSVIKSINKYGWDVEVFDSQPKERKILFCKNKKLL